jgi:hypothetical protein
VIAALAALPGIDVSITASDPFDAVLRNNARTVVLEIKHFQSQPAPRTVRSIVMQLVSGLDRVPDATDVLVVLGGAAGILVDDLRAHLITALTGRARPNVVVWNASDGPKPLEEAILYAA